LDLIVLGWVFKFQHMVYEKQITGKEKEKNYEANDILWKIKGR